MEEVAAARAGLERARDGFLHSLAMIPDDRLNWSPSPTARTPIQLAAHAAQAMGHILQMFQGRTIATPTTEQAEREFREWEGQFTTREEVLDLIGKSTEEALAWYDQLTPERLDDTITFPFGFGTGPLRAVLGVQADHLRWHTAQLDYIQTIYGDHDWHLGA